MNIWTYEVGPELKPFICAEVAQSHDGSLALAHAFIDAIADAGAHAVKFQCHSPKDQKPHEAWRVKPDYPQDDSRAAYWKRTTFTEAQYVGLREHAHERGLAFICSVFGLGAAEMMKRVGVDAWKVPSGRITDGALLAWLKSEPELKIVSTGMATDDEVQAVDLGRYVLLECVSEYPTPAAHCRIPGPEWDGISDHSGTIWPSIAAVAHGAWYVEVHVTTDPAFGFDATSSLSFHELEMLVHGAEFIWTALHNTESKDDVARRLAPMRELFMEQPVA